MSILYGINFFIGEIFYLLQVFAEKSVDSINIYLVVDIIVVSSICLLKKGKKM